MRLGCLAGHERVNRDRGQRKRRLLPWCSAEHCDPPLMIWLFASDSSGRVSTPADDMADDLQRQVAQPRDDKHVVRIQLPALIYANDAGPGPW